MNVIAPGGAGADQRRVVRALESSRVAGAADRALTRLGEWARGSRIVTRVVRGLDGWRTLAAPARWLAGGTTLLVAAIVHVGLTVWQQAPPGWMWLISPGLAAVLGAVLVAAAGAAADRGRRP